MRSTEGDLEDVLIPNTTRPSSPERTPERPSGEAELTRTQRYAYGVGHMFNDLSATCWFSYLLVYLHSVAQLSNATAGERTRGSERQIHASRATHRSHMCARRA
jgi:hypothetical protein